MVAALAPLAMLLVEVILRAMVQVMGVAVVVVHQPYRKVALVLQVLSFSLRIRVIHLPLIQVLAD